MARQRGREERPAPGGTTVEGPRAPRMTPKRRARAPSAMAACRVAFILGVSYSSKLKTCSGVREKRENNNNKKKEAGNENKGVTLKKCHGHAVERDARPHLAVGVVAVGLDLGVGDHDGLEMEPPVAEINQRLAVCRQPWRRTALGAA